MLSDDEHEKLQALAERAGVSASEVVRTRVFGLDDGMLQQDRGSIATRLDMIRDDIERLRTARTKQERDRAAGDARSARAHLKWHVNRVLRAAHLEPLPDDE
ncbi:MAG: hypothetical protein HYZ29_13950 [Myxococcales bacterium]|nr:hypothetical protein [Myxococcales bacterium]